ncbi:tail tubular protein A [Pyramidobacter piscolens W5455]|uniref:Tail tubular protein A n=1 Tax=Pyramidobacter piscolens W5455 TaxID=352165 RepID=A0ABM9ZSA1_9BACT|nr:tail tube A [Pyramidobacter piscolens]EFB89764.1 tail tubular protein A [Pyramidobacter piscolens W5455]
MPNTATELSAVNIMLETIGAAPVASLAGVQNQDVIVAKSVLDQVVREVQGEEFYFNTEKGFPFVPENDGTVRVPNNVTRIYPCAAFYGPKDVVVRGNKLYDKENHTYRFEHPFEADITLCLDFDALPSEVKTYITIRAARKFAVTSLGDDNVEQWTAQDEARARATMIAADTAQGTAHMGVRMKLDPLIGVELSR